MLADRFGHGLDIGFERIQIDQQRRRIDIAQIVTDPGWGGLSHNGVPVSWTVGELTGLETVFQENPKAFGSLCIDTTRMHELMGETRVDWRDGVRRQIENLAPDALKKA